MNHPECAAEQLRQALGANAGRLPDALARRYFDPDRPKRKSADVQDAHCGTCKITFPRLLRTESGITGVRLSVAAILTYGYDFFCRHGRAEDARRLMEISAIWLDGSVPQAPSIYQELREPDDFLDELDLGLRQMSTILRGSADPVDAAWFDVSFLSNLVDSDCTSTIEVGFPGFSGTLMDTGVALMGIAEELARQGNPRAKWLIHVAERYFAVDPCIFFVDVNGSEQMATSLERLHVAKADYLRHCHKPTLKLVPGWFSVSSVLRDISVAATRDDAHRFEAFTFVDYGDVTTVVLTDGHNAFTGTAETE